MYSIHDTCILQIQNTEFKPDPSVYESRKNTIVLQATVTAEISTMRLDMGDMQEALKAHDAWMEDVSQSLQEVHERCQQLSEDIGEHAQSTQAKFDAKTDITAWNDMNDDIDASIKTVRDMASALRLEVDSRRRKVDEDVGNIRETLKTLTEKVDTNANNIQRNSAEMLTGMLFFDARRLFDVDFAKGNSLKNLSILFHSVSFSLQSV